MRHAKKKSRKKFLWIIGIAIIIICFFLWKNDHGPNGMPSNYHADQVNLNVKAAVAIDAKNENVIYAKNANQSLPIASMTKLLTVYLTLKAIKEKKISWDTTVSPTQEIINLSSNPDYAGLPLSLGQKYTVRELYDAALIKSANNAARMLAIAVSGSETNFLNQMRQQANKWKLYNVKLVTVDGLPEKNKNFLGMTTTIENKMSANDMAIIARKLVTDYPEVLSTTKVAKSDFRNTLMTNSNKMLSGLSDYDPNYPVDGLKTGTTDGAGACFTCTMNKNNKRVITVILGAQNDNERFSETKKLLNYSFN
ncbi:D-alanyl-D-alanine carboxypeptidase family protein [Lactobacillus paragasseri]|uniref:D-alanyl-D-alanine carboxypeptidase family protein n=1 Tax=Lactobacillus paragasseri TaxID=2107999 RepID=UPI0029C32AB1|nr:D-alanyl-D-alanine carboxypeptidase family protein [Lactobacillus paragasseri]MDX5115695.1 D-alanyl-D-alanine carboxypeptidase family protein [Lactobacillus paragasseri]MDX5138031.1 D-alanyl-D-alanine carboxypeptidase family protein [Lactobacillus paragasseri]MDX5144512.1 D-alanyl-D-alanine carboxypeptidase family protein [Lactobacillus paragasseri]